MAMAVGLLGAGASARASIEAGFLYNSFTPNVGGLTQIGGRFRSGVFEVDASLLSSQVFVAAAYSLPIPTKTFIHPRWNIGAAYYYSTVNALTGLGVTFRLFKLFGGYIGLTLDTYVLWTVTGSRVAVTPLIPVGASYAF